MHNDKVVLIEDIEREPDKTIQYKCEGKISELEDCTVDAELEREGDSGNHYKWAGAASVG